MLKRLVIVTFFHALAFLTIVFTPQRYKGPDFLRVGYFNLKALDMAAITVIVVGTGLLSYWSFNTLKDQTINNK